MAIRDTAENGLKKWLVGLFTSLLIFWVGWVSAAVIESKQAITHAADVDKKLDDMNRKLDTLLGRP